MAANNDYRVVAKANEEVFRNVLRDMRVNGNQRPGGVIPHDIDTESSIDVIFAKYSTGNRHGQFTICDFSVPTNDSAVIFYTNMAFLSGGGAELEYRVKADNSVVYEKPGMVLRS